MQISVLTIRLSSRRRFGAAGFVSLDFPTVYITVVAGSTRGFQVKNNIFNVLGGKMDDSRHETREIGVQQIDVHTDTRDILARNKAAAIRQRPADLFVVDIDSHHVESEFWGEILERIEDPVHRENALALAKSAGGLPYMYNSAPNLQSVGDRIPHQSARREKTDVTGLHRDLVLTRRAMESIGLDYMIVFPTPLLGLSDHPQVEMQVLLGRAYTHWVVDNLLPQEPRMKTMCLLPITDPAAALQIVKDFGDRKGIVGFVITGNNNKPVHHNDLMPVYAEIEARGLALAFHGGITWNTNQMRTVNRFIGMHALSFVMCNMIHLTNWVLNGMPERFPKLKVIWIESGLAWVPFMMQRLDNEYLMRVSEAPLLKRLPSEYIREMYFSNQPMERTDLDLVKSTFKAIRAETQLLYASDWPHWDFDLPGVIWDLPFLSEDAKRNILGFNAARLYNLEVPKDKRGIAVS